MANWIGGSCPAMANQITGGFILLSAANLKGFLKPELNALKLEREKQLVLKAIKEIELDHQMRKIADADYREMIERYRTRAMRLISEIEVGDNFRELIERELKDRLAMAPAAVVAAPDAAAPVAPAAAVPAASACAACGTVNDPDAQFCKKCGVKLAA